MQLYYKIMKYYLAVPQITRIPDLLVLGFRSRVIA